MPGKSNVTRSLTSAITLIIILLMPLLMIGQAGGAAESQNQTTCSKNIGCVTATLFLENNTLYQGNEQIQPRLYAGALNWTYVPQDLVVSPEAGKVFLSEYYNPQKTSFSIKEIDTTSNLVTSDLNSSKGSGFGSPYEFAISADGGTIFVPNIFGSAIYGLNVSSGLVTVTTPPRSAPGSSSYYAYGFRVPPMALDGDNGLLYAGAYSNNNQSDFLSSMRPGSSFATPVPLLLSKNTSELPIAMTYGQGKNELFVATLSHSKSDPRVTSGALYLFDTLTNRTIGRVPIGGWPSGVAFDPRNGLVYVTNLNSTFGLTVVDPTRLLTVGRIGGIISLGGVAYDNSNGLLYMADGRGSGDTAEVQNITAINDLSNQFIGNITVGYGAMDIAYDQLNQKLYVTNMGSDTVSVISVPAANPTTTSTSTASSSASSIATTAKSSVPTSMSSQTNPSSGIPAFPYQVVPIAVFTSLVIVSYMIFRKRRTIEFAP